MESLFEFPYWKFLLALKEKLATCTKASISIVVAWMAKAKISEKNTTRAQSRHNAEVTVRFPNNVKMSSWEKYWKTWKDTPPSHDRLVSWQEVKNSSDLPQRWWHCGCPVETLDFDWCNCHWQVPFEKKNKKKNKKHFLQGLTLKPRNCHFYLLSVKYHTSFLTFYPPLSCHTLQW